MFMFIDFAGAGCILWVFWCTAKHLYYLKISKVFWSGDPFSTNKLKACHEKEVHRFERTISVFCFTFQIRQQLTVPRFFLCVFRPFNCFQVPLCLDAKKPPRTIDAKRFGRWSVRSSVDWAWPKGNKIWWLFIDLFFECCLRGTYIIYIFKNNIYIIFCINLWFI